MRREPTPAATDDAWLADEIPALYHLLRAGDGDGESLDWLRAKDEGLGLLARALTGDRSARDALARRGRLDLDDLFGPAGEVPAWLRDKRPDLHLFLSALHGDEEALRRLHRKRMLARVVETVRSLGHTAEPDGPDGLVAPAADVGCLVGELHLKQAEYHRAVEAFTRALEASPSADAYEGRARAYEALARADLRHAAELRAALDEAANHRPNHSHPAGEKGR
jgi:tetratricopeptide (TPR) repeat protein